MAEEIVNVRYTAEDVEASVAWYTKHLGFGVISKQILVVDPPGSLVELLQPARR